MQFPPKTEKDFDKMLLLRMGRSSIASLQALPYYDGLLQAASRAGPPKSGAGLVHDAIATLMEATQ
jgi:hypothetical protein